MSLPYGLIQVGSRKKASSLLVQEDIVQLKSRKLRVVLEEMLLAIRGEKIYQKIADISLTDHL